MKKLIFACLFLISFVQIYAQTPSPQILDTEKDIIKDLAFAPAESNTSLNNGLMIELVDCLFHGQGLPGSNPKTRVLSYTLWYYTKLNSNGEVAEWRSVTYEIDMRQQLRVAYQNNSLVITCSTVNARVSEGNNVARGSRGSNVQSLKVVTIPDVTANRRYANMATTLQIKFAALKVHIDRFYK